MTSPGASAPADCDTLNALEEKLRYFEPDTLAGERSLPPLDDAISDEIIARNPDTSAEARRVIALRQERRLRTWAKSLTVHDYGWGNEYKEHEARTFKQLADLVSQRASEKVALSGGVSEPQRGGFVAAPERLLQVSVPEARPKITLAGGTEAPPKSGPQKGSHRGLSFTQWLDVVRKIHQLKQDKVPWTQIAAQYTLVAERTLKDWYRDYRRRYLSTDDEQGVLERGKLIT